MSSDNEFIVRKLEQSLERQFMWIQNADNKINFTFAIDAAMLGFVAATFNWNSSSDWVYQITAFLSLILLGLSVLMASFANFPRTTGPEDSQIFFMGITQLTPEKFLEKMQVNDSLYYIRDLSDQCHRNATIAANKYKWVQRSSLALYFGITPWLIYLASSFDI